MRSLAIALLVACSADPAGLPDQGSDQIEEGQTIAVRFAKSVDIAWYTAPKLVVGERADYVLSLDTQTGAPTPGFLIVDPAAHLPPGTFSLPCSAGDRVITGSVTAVKVLDYDPGSSSEHDPLWSQADVVIETVYCNQP